MNEPPVINERPPNNASAPQAPGRSPGQPQTAGRLLNNRPTIFLLLFCVMGFLGIPLLVKSEAFSRREKVVWSLIVTIYTCLLIWGTAAIVWWSYSNIRDAMAF